MLMSQDSQMTNDDDKRHLLEYCTDQELKDTRTFSMSIFCNILKANIVIFNLQHWLHS